MFETEQGFKDAITGCYMLMTNTNLYGRDLTAGFMEIAARQFVTDNMASNNYYSVSLLEWEDGVARTYIDNFWSGMYNIIANVNNIIENIDERRGVLHPTNYNIIKGEAYGLRGFLHFELLRMFGYGDLADHPEYMENMTIPYSRSYNKVFAEQYTQKKVVEMAIEDLETAVELLESFDPWSTAAKDDGYVLPNEDGFYTTRATHFNYQAAKATLARIHIWTGEYEKALPILEDFILSSSDIDGLDWVTSTYIDNTGDVNNDMTFSMEHIFRLDVNRLWEKVKTQYDQDAARPNENRNLFYITPANMSPMFEVPGKGDSDYRYSKLLNNKDGKISVKKFIDFEGKQYADRMPVIRMSEMYYMAAECLISNGRKDEAAEMINTVIRNRGISDAYWLNEDDPEERVREELEKEWRKEFLGEGQMFYYYKRMGLELLGGYQLSDPIGVYVFPIPENEIDQGGRVNNLPKDDNL
jgi:tetratricopeptide (TPR) repeat protein